MTGEPAISIKGLTRRFGNQIAVDNLDLEIYPGEIFGLLGPNGAGKSTTIATILGTRRPTSGTVAVFGLDVATESRRIRAMTGYVMQQSAHDKLLTGRENCKLQAELFGLRGRQRDRRVEEVLRWAGLQDAGDRVVRTYSGGMMRRLDLAIGMLHNPQLVVLDEPTLGLDIETRRRLWDLISRLRDDGVTILLTTHYLEEASQLCDRVGIMHQGRIVGLGSPDELKQKHLGGGHRLRLSLQDVESLERAQLPVSPARVNGEVIFDGPPDQLWATLGAIHANHPGAIQAVTYQQPTLDDVFLQLTGSEVGQ